MSLAQFGILNALWAFTIVLCELPSGALADTIGRRKLVRLLRFAWCWRCAYYC